MPREAHVRESWIVAVVIPAKCHQGNPIGQDIGWAVTVGALAPLASGEVGIVAAGESVVGETAANIFSGITGLWGIVGAAIDPNSSNGIITNSASCAK